MRKWFLVIMLLLIAVLVAFGIFVATGVIDGPALFWQIAPRIGWLEPHLETYSRGKDTEEWVRAKEEEGQALVSEVAQREEALILRAAELAQKQQQLDKREQDLSQLAAKLEAIQAQQHSVQTLAHLYTEMSAEEAARILEKLDTALILEVLLAMNMQDAATILTELPTNLAVTLSKEIGKASQ